MYKIVDVFPHELLNATEGPFISLYQPTHRHRPDRQKDLITFKNLVREMERSLEQKYPMREKKPILDLFNQLGNDRPFWTYAADGIAVLYSQGQAIVYKLNRPVKELVDVANSFHIKPLLRKFQSAERYHVLGLDREGFTLFEGNRYGVSEVDLDDDLPNNIREVLGDDFSSSYISGRYGGIAGEGNYHGHGDKSKIISKDTEKFFRFVDEVVLENYSKPTGLPLILVALPEYHSLFRKISRNPFLLADGIRTNYDILTVEELKDEMWKVVEPSYISKTNELVADFGQAKVQALASDDLVHIAKSIISNRVKTVLIESDRVISGRINRVSGAIEEGELSHPEFGDLLNDVALLTMQHGGKVVMLPKERMPSSAGVAAIYRF